MSTDPTHPTGQRPPSRADRSTGGLDRLAASRRLAYVLRHDPGSVGLTVDPAGWVAVSELLAALSAAGLELTRADLGDLVDVEGKRRFGYDAAGSRVRALQGHSVPVDLGLAPVSPPTVLFHGTQASALGSILGRGLLRRSRTHVHLSETAEAARVVGARRSGPATLLRVAAAAMAADGHAFFRAENGVWLTDHVPARYLEPDTPLG